MRFRHALLLRRLPRSATRTPPLTSVRACALLLSWKAISSKGKNFIQRQKLVSIPKVFECEGFFIFWENDVLLWKTVQPVRTTSVYTDQNFKTYVHLNDKTITNTSLSATNIINRILWALLNNDMTALELDFQIFTQNNDSGWRMDFYPRSNMTGSIVKHVLVKGASAPQKIVVENYSNDITTLEISEITRSEISSSRQENELANP